MLLFHFFHKQVEKQINQLKQNNSKFANILDLLLKITEPVDFSDCGEIISNLYESKNIDFKSKFRK